MYSSSKYIFLFSFVSMDYNNKKGEKSNGKSPVMMEDDGDWRVLQ